MDIISNFDEVIGESDGKQLLPGPEKRAWKATTTDQEPPSKTQWRAKPLTKPVAGDSAPPPPTKPDAPERCMTSDDMIIVGNNLPRQFFASAIQIGSPFVHQPTNRNPPPSLPMEHRVGVRSHLGFRGPFIASGPQSPGDGTDGEKPPAVCSG